VDSLPGMVNERGKGDGCLKLFNEINQLTSLPRSWPQLLRRFEREFYWNFAGCILQFHGGTLQERT
jgi:hypothetical protein